MGRLFFCLALVASLSLTGCRRSAGDVWEDTKSGGRHMGRGFQALAGKHPQSKQIQNLQDWAGPKEEEFIPLADEEIYAKIVVGEIDENSGVPQSRLSPGELGSNIPGIEGFRDPNSAELSGIFKRIHFETDQYAIRGGENQRIVKSIVQYLRQHPNAYVFIEGHCDERGAAAYNLALGSRRSNAVRNALIKEGVDLDRIFTISYGKERPVAQGHGQGDWEKNRRAQFKLYERS